MSWHADKCEDYVDDILDGISDWDPDQDFRDRLRERLEEKGSYVFEDGDWEKLRTIALRLASTKFDAVFCLIADTGVPQEIVASLVTTENFRCHPFLSLRTLTLHVENATELYLLFYSHLFPKLRHLKLLGQVDVDTFENVVHDVNMFRYSVTA